jgi:Flp pilus assembly protein TadD
MFASLLPSTTLGRSPLVLSRGIDRFAVLAVAALLLAAAGCGSLASRRGPVSQSVASGRQLTEQGISAMERGDWKRAESLLARAVETSPADADARRQYAEALWHRGAMSEALVQLEQAREVVREDPALAVRAGEVQLALGQTDKALTLADEALRWDPKFAPAWALRGRVASATAQPRQALALYQRSLGYAPQDQQVAILVAETYRQLNEPERALTTLQSIAERYASGEEPQQVLFLQGLALTALGRYDDAIGHLSKAARRERPNPEILCRLAEAELLAGHMSQAQVSLQEALAMDPNHAASRALSQRMTVAARSNTADGTAK